MVDGKVLLFTRNGIFQVRLYKGKRQYIYKSLKTRDLAKARELAVRAHYELEFRKEEQLPLQIKRFSDVLNEYERLRESQNARGTYAHSNKANQQQTSGYMLRQIGFVAQIASSKDSLCESSVLAGGHEQLDPYEVQDPELGRV